MASSLGQRGQVSAQNLVPSKYLLRGVDQAEQVLGRGAYGVVFSGDWRGTPVAIKRHHPMLVLDEHEQFSTFYRQFLQEFPMLKELPHPNIVQVFGMVAATGPHDTPGLVMECLSQTLRKRCSVQPALSLLEKCSIALGISSALEYLHSRSIIHRDLTTNNIMLCEVVEAGDVQLKAKITDVGGAAELDDRTQAQMMTMNPGAQTYMAPETQRVSNEPGRAQYGTPADCYSFAVCLLAMCVGKEPPNIFKLVREGRTKDLQELGSDHPFHDIISKCLKVDPAERPTATYICASFGAMIKIIRRQQQQPAANSSTAGDTQANTSEPSPDQAEIVHLRQELQECDEQLRGAQQQRATALHALQDRTTVLAERDQLLHTIQVQLATAQQAVQDQTAVLVERDQLMHTIQEQLTAAQHAVQDRTVLLAERDELLMERGAALELSASAESAVVQNTRELLVHLASMEGELGELSRCSLLLGPPDVPTHETHPKTVWKTIGKLPIPEGHLSVVASLTCNDGRITGALLSRRHRPNWRIVSADADNLELTAWVDLNLPEYVCGHPEESETCIVRQHRGSLYCLVVPSATPAILYKRTQNDQWRELARLPEYRFRFFVTFFDTQVVVIGGSASPDTSVFVPARFDVISFDLTEGNTEWVVWPNLPASAGLLSAPPAIVYDGHLHVFCSDHDKPAVTYIVFSTPVAQPVSFRTWSSTALPHPPFMEFCPLLFNGFLICFRAKASSGRRENIFMLSPNSSQWFPLSYTDALNGCLCEVGSRLLVFTSRKIRHLCWESVARSQPRGRKGSVLRLN